MELLGSRRWFHRARGDDATGNVVQLIAFMKNRNQLCSTKYTFQYYSGVGETKIYGTGNKQIFSTESERRPTPKTMILTS